MLAFLALASLAVQVGLLVFIVQDWLRGFPARDRAVPTVWILWGLALLGNLTVFILS